MRVLRSIFILALSAAWELRSCLVRSFTSKFNTLTSTNSVATCAYNSAFLIFSACVALGPSEDNC